MAVTRLPINLFRINGLAGVVSVDGYYGWFRDFIVKLLIWLGKLIKLLEPILIGG